MLVYFQAQSCMGPFVGMQELNCEIDRNAGIELWDWYEIPVFQMSLGLEWIWKYMGRILAQLAQ